MIFLHNDVVITVLSGLVKQTRIETFHKDVAIEISRNFYISTVS